MVPILLKALRNLFDWLCCVQIFAALTRFDNLIMIQCDGSNDDLDWRIDFKYPNFICIIEYLRFRFRFRFE